MKSLAKSADVAEIQQRISRLCADTPRQWGRMSPHQMVCHLNDSFMIATGERHASPATGIRERTIIKWLALYLPVPWPKGIPTRPEVDQFGCGTVPVDFERDRAFLSSIIERVINERIDGRSHPIFGPMSRRLWLRWGYLHTDHHLRQFGL
jgi:hypothetical protein